MMRVKREAKGRAVHLLGNLDGGYLTTSVERRPIVSPRSDSAMPAPRGRTKGFVMDDSHRVKIQNSNILNALIEHVDGKRKMSSTQVSAGIALLKKVLSDLSSVDIRGPGENGEHLHKVIADEAFARIASRLAGVDPATQSRPDSAE